MPTIPTTVTTTTTKPETPEQLRPYTAHGLVLSATGDERLGCCPFCDRDGKFSVNVNTGQWRCFICGGGMDKGGGGPVDFIRRIWEESDKATTNDDYKVLAEELGLLYPDTVLACGLAKSVLTGNWLIPGYSYNGEGKLYLSQLYSYVQVGPRMATLPTPGRKHTLLGLNLVNPSSGELQVAEGFKDWLRWWEAMRTTKGDEDGNLTLTSSLDASIGRNVSVVGAPTCSSFPVGLPGSLFQGKIVTFLYDNDHAYIHEKTKKLVPAAGYEGMKRDALKVPTAATVQILRWGDNGFDPNLPHGYDIGDLLKQDRYSGIAHVLNHLEEVPPEWRVGSDSGGGGEIGCKPCKDWLTLRNAWRRALKWTEGLEHGLTTMLACIVSTDSIGDQFWMKLIGPASSAKSTLCEAVTVNKKYIYAKSTIRGFHSGYKDATSKEDNSLIPHIKNRTLVTKDGDTLLQAPNLSQILAEARDVYDSVSRTHYRNNMGKDYAGIRCTWILCGTASLRAIDSSELGERFLDVVIMDEIDAELEDEIIWRKVNQAERHVGIEVNCDVRSHYAPELLEAMELTGGYIDHLKENATKTLPGIVCSTQAKQQVAYLAKFVAYMRARPSRHQREKAERELGARLASVQMRAAKCLAYVLNRNEVDAEVINRIRQMAFNTARGTSLDIVRMIHKEGFRGMEKGAITYQFNQAPSEIEHLLRFMRGIKILLNTKIEDRNVWVLTPEFRKLYENVINCTTSAAD